MNKDKKQTNKQKQQPVRVYIPHGLSDEFK